MAFDEFLKEKDDELDTYNYPQECMRMAWDFALKEAEKLVAARFDEQEPWLEPGEITKIVNEPSY